MIKFIDLPSPNFFAYKGETKAICLHGTASPLQPALNWLRNPQPDNPDNRVSANFLVSKTGVIYRLVDFELGRSAWGNGVVENYDRSIKWLCDAVKTRINPNVLTVSIEHEATAFEMRNYASMPDVQFNASIDLCAYILKKCNLSANHQTIIGHNQISGVNKFTCPGVIFPPAFTEVLIMRYSELA